jgi:hypothetical protein
MENTLLHGVDEVASSTIGVDNEPGIDEPRWANSAAT